jgi:hypothetical protein
MMARKRSILYLTNKGLQLDLSAHALSKLFARYEIFKMVLNLPGDIVDCGVYRGASLFSCENLIKIFAPHSQKVVIGFDTFSGFSSNLHIMEDRDHSVKLMEDRTRFLPRSGFDDQSRASPVSQPANTGGYYRRDQKPEREGSCGDAAIPPEFIEDLREQQGIGSAGVDPNCHSHEGNPDEEPSLEERQSDLSCRLRPAPSLQSFAVHDAIRFKGLSGYATRRMYKMRHTSGASDDRKRVGLPSDPLDPAQKTARSRGMDIDVIGAVIS